MNARFRAIALTAGVVMTLLAMPTAQAELTPAEQAAVFKAAGFKQGAEGRYIRCEEDPPTLSYSPGRIEMEDLNGDGQPEAWVKEGSLFCYGNTGEAFVLLNKGAGGWRVLLDAVGVPTLQQSKRSGWPDIEVGGPGFGKFPVYRWDGKAYILPR